MYVCMYVCLYVRNGFTVYVPFGTCCSGCHRAMAWRSRSRTRKIEDDARTIAEYSTASSRQRFELRHFDLSMCST